MKDYLGVGIYSSVGHLKVELTEVENHLQTVEQSQLRHFEVVE